MCMSHVALEVTLVIKELPPGQLPDVLSLCQFSLCLRAGWSLDDVKDKYLSHENTGDQYVGCCALGPSADTAEFAVCKAHFDLSSLTTQEERIDRVNMIKKWLSDCLPSDNTEHTYDLEIKCFADICYHYKHLNENSTKMYPTKSSRFQGYPRCFFGCSSLPIHGPRPSAHQNYLVYLLMSLSCTR